MRAVFLGTPDIAVPALSALTEIAEIVSVVCQPDRPAGRGLVLTPPAVKSRALELGLQVVQPASIRTPEFAAWFSSLHADVAVVLAYGRILPAPVLQAPARGCLNLHASVLPRYRGAAPITWAIVRGETETGISLMQMDAGLDTGPVYAVRRLQIGEDETAGELGARIAVLAAEVVRSDVPRVVAGDLPAMPQNDAEATLAPRLAKQDGHVDWTQAAARVHDHVRGMSPWPGAFTTVAGKTLRVLETRRTDFTRGDAAPGTLVAADAEGVLIACGEGVLELARGQLEGRKALAGRDLAIGRSLRLGEKLA
jgi:methionyl-tRNA formyltransferase